jgi:hypothetical protein
MAIGLFVGGAIAGYQRTRVQAALVRAASVAGLTIALAFAGDMARRFALEEGAQTSLIGPGRYLV